MIDVLSRGVYRRVESSACVFATIAASLDQSAKFYSLVERVVAHESPERRHRELYSAYLELS